MPYRGTSMQNQSSTPSPSPATLAAPAVSDAKKPKKGSYKEIMARAQAVAAQAKTPAGTISHKAKDKAQLSYKKEMKMKQKELRDKKLGIVRKDSRPSSSDGHASSGAAPAKTINAKKLPQPSYTGTAKPKPQPSYKGTMGSAPGGKKSSAKPAPKRRTNEYAATDDEMESEGEDDEECGYGYFEGQEEDSDDMEAGFSDVEQEESAAARAARKEDEEEAKLEAKLKREKEERKKRLEMMAKKAKPPRY